MSAQVPARGARRWLVTRPFSARRVSIRLVTSGGSMTLNSAGSENDSACARMIWWATAWKVPPTTRSAAPAPPDPGQHVVCGPAGERQQQDPGGRRALAAQPARPGDQGPGLAGARPGQDQQRPGLMRGRPALVVVEPVKDIRRFEHEDECNGRGRAGRGPTPAEIRTGPPDVRPSACVPGGRRPRYAAAPPS